MCLFAFALSPALICHITYGRGICGLLAIVPGSPDGRAQDGQPLLWNLRLVIGKMGINDGQCAGLPDGKNSYEETAILWCENAHLARGMRLTDIHKVIWRPFPSLRWMCCLPLACLALLSVCVAFLERQGCGCFCSAVVEGAAGHSPPCSVGL